MALVLLMTIPGLALFYAGMVRKKNILATMMQSFVITCLVTVIWFVCGYRSPSHGDSPYHRGPRRASSCKTSWGPIMATTVTILGAGADVPAGPSPSWST